jgi:H+-transporting ATPase
MAEAKREEPLKEQGGDIEAGAGGLGGAPAKDVFVPTDVAVGLTTEQVEAARAVYGVNEIPVPETPLYMLFLHQFTGFLPFLIELAAIVALAVQDYIDFGIIAAILLVNGVLGFREEYHAKKSLDELSNSIESEVSVRRNGATANVPTKELVPGDIILLVGGTVVPADVKWISGDKMQIDTAPLTGEPLPRTYGFCVCFAGTGFDPIVSTSVAVLRTRDIVPRIAWFAPRTHIVPSFASLTSLISVSFNTGKYPSSDYGDVILSGTTVVAGECYGQIVNTGTHTEIGKAQESILQDKSVRVVSVFQTKIMTVVQILVSGCLALVIAVLLVQGIAYKGFDTSPRDVILDALSILIASIPVALPLVLQVNLALGASFMAREHHSIVTSIPALQDIASMSMLCSDKTGTLTTANMTIILDRIYAAGGFVQDDVILYAFLCSNADKKDDPIDRAIVGAFNGSSAKPRESEYKQKEIIGFNPTVKRVVAFVEHHGQTITIAKGLPAKCLDTAAGGVDDHELQWKVDMLSNKQYMKDVTSTDEDLSKNGYKTIGVSVCMGDAREIENPVWKFVGLLPMLDPPRADTAATINSLHHANISVKMITGDHRSVGVETARLIGLGTDIRTGEEVRNAPDGIKKQMIWNADGFASVLPSDKREAVLTLRNDFKLVVGMTG